MMLIAALILAMPAPTFQEKEMKEDTELVAKLKKAFADRLDPKQVIALVGRRPTIDSSIPDEDLALKLANVGADPQEQRFTGFGNYERVIYWVRPVERTPPKIVGIVWRKDGPELFFAVVHKPRS